MTMVTKESFFYLPFNLFKKLLYTVYKENQREARDFFFSRQYFDSLSVWVERLYTRLFKETASQDIHALGDLFQSRCLTNLSLIANPLKDTVVLFKHNLDLYQILCILFLNT